MTQKSIKIGDFLLRKRNAIDIQDSQTYKRVTIKIKRNGISLRDSVIGTEIGTKKQFTIKQGQFLISKIDARNGAFGIVPQEVDGGIITGNFWTFDIDEKIVDRDYFLSFISTNAFDEICEKTSSGTTNRKYLDEKKFLKFEIHIPETIEEQRKIVENYFKAQSQFTALRNLSEKNEKLIKSLKSSILQDAIQGKLVPQDPSDEPASILIEKIQSEKAKLIAEGKFKKQKPLAPITLEEIPYELPNGWEWVRLGDIGIIRGGKRIPKGCGFSKTITEHIYLRVSDMVNGTISDIDLQYIDAAVYNLIKDYTIGSSDIYMTIVGGTIGKCGEIPERFNNMNLTENAAKISCLLLEKYYIINYLKSEFCQKYLWDKVKQVGVQKLSLDSLSKLLVPLPPLQQQERIIEKINEIMKSCELLDIQLKQAKERSAKLMESILQGVFNS